MAGRLSRNANPLLDAAERLGHRQAAIRRDRFRGVFAASNESLPTGTAKQNFG